MKAFPSSGLAGGGSPVPAHAAIGTTKFCNGCERTLLVDAFSMKNKATGRRHSRCKECQRGYTRTHYVDNRQLYIDRAATRNKTLRKAHQADVDTYLANRTCCCCEQPAARLLRKPGYGGLAVHEVMSAKMNSAALETALLNSDVFCGSCYGEHITSNLKNYAEPAVSRASAFA